MNSENNTEAEAVVSKLQDEVQIRRLGLRQYKVPVCDPRLPIELSGRCPQCENIVTLAMYRSWITKTWMVAAHSGSDHWEERDLQCPYCGRFVNIEFRVEVDIVTREKEQSL
jgi:hypothetical protein